MKKLVMLATMLALVAAVSVPAIAQINQGFAVRNESGNVSTTFMVNSTGDNSNQCVTPLQFGNTGSQQNVQGSLQYASSSGELNFTGPSFTFAPTLSASCDQKVQQSSAASSGG